MVGYPISCKVGVIANHGPEQVAEKPRMDGEDSEESPAGAKAHLVFCCICGTTEVVP